VRDLARIDAGASIAVVVQTHSLSDRAPLSEGERHALIRAASYASVGTALLLVILKGSAWLITGSVAVLSSLADSMLDVLASLVTFWAIRVSLSPADTQHRFGHGKSEGLSALMQSFVIAGSALFVCFEAIPRLVRPAPIEKPAVGVIVSLGSILATVLLVAFQRFVTSRTRSIAISADSIHYTSDILLNLGVGVAVLANAWLGWPIADPLVGLAIAFYILFGAVRIGSQSLNILLDHEIPDHDRENVRRLALAHTEVKGIHDLRTRHGGSHYIVQFHVDLPRDISLWRSHEILDEIEEKIRAAYPGCEIITHADPLGIVETKDNFDHPTSSQPRRVAGR
jgi:ferrous-iron efflux pump FieF